MPDLTYIIETTDEAVLLMTAEYRLKVSYKVCLKNLLHRFYFKQ